MVDTIIHNTWGDIKKTFTRQDMLYIMQELEEYEGREHVDNQRKKVSGAFTHFIKYLLYRNLANYDSMVLLTGNKGAGKSSVAIMMAREWCKLIGIKFNPKRHIAYNNADVMDKIDTLKKFEPIVCDEAVRFACLDGDTEVITLDGAKKIKKLEGEKNFKVLSLNKENKRLEFKKARECKRVKEDWVYEIETEDSKKIKATKEHKFLTEEGYKELKDLKEGDEIYGVNNSITSCKFKIKSIKKVKKAPVYDIIDVEDNNNFVANKFITHNSSADWAKKENKELRLKLAQVRTKHLFYILCFPLKIEKMEKNYLDSFVNYWCLTGDTKVITRNKLGQVKNIPISKVNKFFPEVLSYNIKTKKYEWKKYDKKVKTKKDAEVFEITLDNGLKVKATEDHPFLTQRGWVRLKDLKYTDEIEVKGKECVYCKKEYVPKRLSQIFCCIECQSKYNYKINEDKILKYRKDYWKKTKAHQRKIGKQKYLENREEILKQAEEYRKNNREILRLRARKFREENIERLRKRDRDLYKIPARKIESKLSSWFLRVPKTIRNKGVHVRDYIGCSFEEFSEYIESKFKKGMSWKNWNSFGWHLDHIRPLCSFNLNKESEVKKCFNYTNYQPLWKEENEEKGAKYEGKNYMYKKIREEARRL